MTISKIATCDFAMGADGGAGNDCSSDDNRSFDNGSTVRSHWTQDVRLPSDMVFSILFCMVYELKGRLRLTEHPVDGRVPRPTTAHLPWPRRLLFDYANVMFWYVRLCSTRRISRGPKRRADGCCPLVRGSDIAAACAAAQV